MPSRNAIAWGCAIAGLVCLSGVAAVVLFLVYVSKDAKGVGVAVDGPTDVVVGQTFELNVTVTNERPRKVLALSTIDIAQGYLAGFSVSTIEPRSRSSVHVPFDNSRSFKFAAQISPGASRILTFTLRAEKPGLYRGDVDVCEGAFHHRHGADVRKGEIMMSRNFNRVVARLASGSQHETLVKI